MLCALTWISIEPCCLCRDTKLSIMSGGLSTQEVCYSEAELKRNRWVCPLFPKGIFYYFKPRVPRHKKRRQCMLEEHQLPRRTLGMTAQGCHCSVGSGAVENPQGSKSLHGPVWTCLHSAVYPCWVSQADMLLGLS